MALSKQDLKILKAIHSQVMERFRYKTDQAKWGRIEHWEDDEALIAKVRSYGKIIDGDCEEAARAFMYLAQQSGYNARLIVGLDEDNNGHCWCEVADSEYATAVYLDNRCDRPMPLSKMQHMTPMAASPWNPIQGERRDWVRLKLK